MRCCCCCARCEARYTRTAGADADAVARSGLRGRLLSASKCAVEGSTEIRLTAADLREVTREPTTRRMSTETGTHWQVVTTTCAQARQLIDTQSLDATDSDRRIRRMECNAESSVCLVEE